MEDQSLFITLQLIPPLPGLKDPSLRSLLTPGIPISLEQCLHVGLHVARGMNYATSKIPGLLHRDLKPENILIGPDGSARITDFGILKVLNINDIHYQYNNHFPVFSHDKLTKGILGTPLYISPEQWAGSNIDERSDIYALGMILLECLLGYIPLNTTNIETIITSHINGAPYSELCKSSLIQLLRNSSMDFFIRILNNVIRTGAS